MTAIPKLPTTAEVRARMIRSQLTVGLAGGWVLFASWLVHVLVMLGVISLATKSFWHFDGSDVIGMLEVAVVLAWLVGWILGVIGWFALAKVDRSKTLMAWLTAALFVVVIVGTAAAVELGYRHGSAATGMLVIMTVAAYYLAHGIVWLGHPTHRGLARTAALASFATTATLIVGVAALYAGDVSSLGLFVATMIAGPCAAAIAHLASGLVMGRERASVSAFTSFD